MGKLNQEDNRLVERGKAGSFITLYNVMPETAGGEIRTRIGHVGDHSLSCLAYVEYLIGAAFLYSHSPI